jgi:hypothetical protein
MLIIWRSNVFKHILLLLLHSLLLDFSNWSTPIVIPTQLHRKLLTVVWRISDHGWIIVFETIIIIIKVERCWASQHWLLGLVRVVIVNYSHSLNCSNLLLLLLIWRTPLRGRWSFHTRTHLSYRLFKHRCNLITFISLIFVVFNCFFDFFIVDICIAQRALVINVDQFGHKPFIDAFWVKNVRANRNLPHWGT